MLHIWRVIRIKGHEAKPRSIHSMIVVAETVEDACAVRPRLATQHIWPMADGLAAQRIGMAESAIAPNSILATEWTEFGVDPALT